MHVSLLSHCEFFWLNRHQLMKQFLVLLVFTSLVMSTVHGIIVHTVRASDALTGSHYCIKKHLLHPCFISDRPSSQSSIDLILLTTRPFLLNTMHCPIHKILSASAIRTKQMSTCFSQMRAYYVPALISKHI